MVYSNVDREKLAIEGVPNEVFSQRIPVTRCWGEAKRFFFSKAELHEKMTVQTFYKFALVINLRSHHDNLKGLGRKVVNTQSGVFLEITKEGYHGKRRV